MQLNDELRSRRLDKSHGQAGRWTRLSHLGGGMRWRIHEAKAAAISTLNLRADHKRGQEEGEARHVTRGRRDKMRSVRVWSEQGQENSRADLVLAERRVPHSK